MYELNAHSYTVITVCIKLPVDFNFGLANMNSREKEENVTVFSNTSCFVNKHTEAKLQWWKLWDSSGDKVVIFFIFFQVYKQLRQNENRKQSCKIKQNVLSRLTTRVRLLVQCICVTALLTSTHAREKQCNGSSVWKRGDEGGVWGACFN